MKMFPLRRVLVPVSGLLVAVVIATVHGIIHFHMQPLSSLGNTLGLLFLGGIVGPLIGLSSTAPYFVPAFKLFLAAGLAVSGALVVIGCSGATNWWRWLAGVAGINLWLITGLIGVGPV